MAHEWHGVFSPKGELEAVEHSEAAAGHAAAALSPDRKHPNRTVRPVVVMSDDVNILELMASAALNVYHSKRDALIAADEKLQRETKAASLDKVAMTGDYWHDAHRKRLIAEVAHRVLGAVAELYVNQPKEPRL